MMSGLLQTPRNVQAVKHRTQMNLHSGLHSLSKPCADLAKADRRMVLTVFTAIRG